MATGFHRVGFYPGSFDPPTLGHADIIRQALAVVDRLVVGVGAHQSKVPLLAASERCRLILLMVEEMGLEQGRVEAMMFSSLAVDAARQSGASLLVRGLRGGGDYEDEVSLAGMNRILAPELVTVWFPAALKGRVISSSIVRQLVMLGGDVHGFVPGVVADYLQRQYVSSAPGSKPDPKSGLNPDPKSGQASAQGDET